MPRSYTPQQIELARQIGKTGGRRRTVQHNPESYCRCAECRGTRGESKRSLEADLEKSKIRVAVAGPSVLRLQDALQELKLDPSFDWGL